MVGSARLSISKNIKKVLDHYNDEDQETQINYSQYDDLENYNLSRQKQNTSFKLALNGNRLNTSLVIKYNDTIKNLIHQQGETPKSQNISFGDLTNSYLIPASLKIDEDNNNSFDKKDLWHYTATLIPHIQSIPAPPPQSFPV